MENNSLADEAKPETAYKYPGCFKKSVAFFIDQIVIAIIGIVLLFPFSGFIGSLYYHAWIPGYLIGAIYFTVLESSIFNSQSLGKRIFSFEVRTIENKPISPQISFGRYILLTFPFYNGAISNSLATTIGITDSTIGGSIFLVIVGLLAVGNSVFMLFHPQKRGLHDIILRTVVVPAKSEQPLSVKSFTLKPVLSGIAGLAILGLLFGNIFLTIGKNPDFADLTELTENIRKESGMDNLNVTYRTFSMNGEQTMFAIEVNVPIHYDKFDDTSYTDELSEKLYPLVKKVNTNPNVDTIKIAFHAQKYFGAFPITKTKNTPRKRSEI